ncbi:MAG TPA: DNA polymerase III subunit gamma/tau [Anaerolineaceae bacterium]|nr:DNA polymerase III subunit gamma/tau [Anaerolineaceae bacterium]
MTQALYRKWRPRKWDQVIAQDHVVKTLRNAIQADKVGHAYLLSGPRGTGKTTTARLLAKAVNCLSPDLANRPCDGCKNCIAVNESRYLDLIEIDAASNTSVEDVRDLRDKINFSPSDGKYKVYIIDEVHMLSTAAFNALLKTLEEPPAHAIFILATTEVHKIPATVLSRCQRHEFRRIPVMDIVSTLKTLCTEEKIDADEEALILIARQSTGAMRDGISLLDQLASTGERITLELAQLVLGTATNQLVIDLVNAIQASDTARGLEVIHRALDGGSDPRQYARQVVEYLRNLLLIRMGNDKQVDATKESKDLMHKHSQSVETAVLMEWMRLFNEAINDIRTSWQPGMALEIAFARAVEGLQTVDVKPAAEKHTKTSEPIAAVEPKSSEKSAPKITEQSAIKTSEKESLKPVQAGAASVVLSSHTGSEVTAQDIQANWNTIRAEVKGQRSQTEALLNSHKSLQIKDGALVIGFASEVLKSKMESAENLEVTRRAIHHLLKVDLPIVCIVVSGKTSSSSVDLDVDADGIVGTALNLGGKLRQ